MQEELQVALIQSDLVWENPNENRTNFANKIHSISEKVDIIILPEMFTTGFTMSPENIAETMQGETVKWMRVIAEQKQVALCGSVVIKDEGVFYNRFIFMKPSGEYDTYDKWHTFTLAGEHKVYNSGTKKIIIDYKGWKICPLICYDLRFPVLARNIEDYDVLIYVASWPKRRVAAWDALLKARAIENMSYCVGVNRVGVDANGHEYSGHSAIYDGMGEELSNIMENKEQIEIIAIRKTHLKIIREKLQFLNDRDEFTLNSLKGS